MKRRSGILVLVAVVGCGASDDTDQASRPVTAPNGLVANGLGSNGVALNGVMLNGVMLNGVEGNGVMLNGVMLNGVMLNGVMLNGVMLNGVMLNGVMLNGVMLNGSQQGSFRQMFELIAGCALTPGQCVTVTDFDGTSQLTFCGNSTGTAGVDHSIDPGWAGGSADLDQQGAMGQCVLDHGGSIGVTHSSAVVDGFKVLFRYMVECALPEGDTLTYYDENDQPVTVAGVFGLAPEWRDGPASPDGQELVTACLMARTNGDGSQVSISLRSPEIASTPEEQNLYRHHEGAFMGNLFAASPWVKTCKGSDGVWTAGRVCVGGSCGFQDLGSCQTACAVHDPERGDDDCGPSYSHRNVVNTFLYTNADFSADTVHPYPAGDNPQSLATADLDNDGVSDLIVGARSSNGSVFGGVWVLLGNGDGTFAEGQRYAGGENPSGVAAADLDGDGALDLITSNSFGNKVSVFLGNGDGTFGSAADYPATHAGGSLAITDIDGDGDTDVVVNKVRGYASASGVHVLHNNGDGTLAPAVYYSGGGSAVAVADLDGDSSPDLITTYGASGYPGIDNAVGVRLGNCDGTFATEVRYTVDRPARLAVGDVDGDGVLDVVTGTVNYGTVTLLRGNGDGTFTTQPLAGSLGGPSVALADVSGDGALDLITPRVAVHINSGDGTFGNPRLHAVGPGPSDVAAGDFNGDGALDLITANSESNDVSVLLNTGGGNFWRRALRTGGDPVAAVADLDNDAIIDVVAANSTGSVSVMLGTGGGDYAPMVNYGVGTAGVWRRDLAIVDLDGDNAPDLVTTNPTSDDVSVLLGAGDGTFAAEVRYLAGVRPESLATADLNGDGALDLITANSESDDVSVLLGAGDGTFAGQVRYPAGDYPASIAAADVDGDGAPDLITANSFSGDVSVLRNSGSGAFAPQVRHAIGYYPEAVAAADLDGDGAADLAIARYYNNEVQVWFGGGDGSFPRRTRYGLLDHPSSVTIADVNGDSKLDLVTSSRYDDQYERYNELDVSVLLGNGAGTFSTQLWFDVGSEASRAVVADMDGNGSADLIVGRLDQNDVLILRSAVPGAPVCGDGTCEVGEDCSTCAADCGACAPTCNTCTVTDCGACGSSVELVTDCDLCGSSGNGKNRTCNTCEVSVCNSCEVTDCGLCGDTDCGDGYCAPDEDCQSCSADCGACPAAACSAFDVCTPAGDSCSVDADCCDGLTCGKVKGQLTCR